jgi:hypothetical protein
VLGATFVGRKKSEETGISQWWSMEIIYKIINIEIAGKIK